MTPRTKEQREDAGIAALIGIVCMSVSIGYLTRPAWGWFTFGCWFTLFALLDDLEHWRRD